MKYFIVPIIALSVALAGCSATNQNKHVTQGVQKLQTASVHLEKAKGASARAKEKITNAESAIQKLRETATPQQIPLVDLIAVSHVETKREIAILDQEVSAAQKSGEEGAVLLLKAGEDHQKAMIKVQRYHRLKMWMAVLAAAVAGFIAFRAIPPVVGPYRLWAVGGAALGTATIVWAIL